MEDYGIVNNAILEQAGYFEKHIDKNVVVDTDAHFIIDAITRKIKNTGDKKELVQGDHNSERFTFECPRYIEGHDMTLVNKIIVNYMNVSISGAYEVDDLTSDDEKITFSWLISKNATENVGKLVFAISFKCVQEDEKITYEWHTTINDDIRIIDGLNNETSIVEDNVDILEQWKRELFGASDGEVSKIQEASNQAQTEIEELTTASKNAIGDLATNSRKAIAEISTTAKNDIETLATNSKKEISDLTEEKKTELNNLNDDITTNANSLKEAIVNAADAKKEEINQKGLEVLQSIPEDMGKIQDTTLIKSTESGTDMVLTDSSDMNIQKLHLFGKSEQKTTKGIQLLDLSSMRSGTGDGLTYTNRGDGSVQVSGTATSQTGNIWFRGRYDTNSEKLPTLLTLEAGKKYYIKDCILFEVATNINTQTEVIEVSAEEYPEGRRITGIRNPRQVVGKTYNEVIYPLIAESSTAVDWEEYTGGTASPNPDYPQEMNCVENPTVSVAGKNLLVNNAKSKQIRNLIYTVNEDKSISVKGTYEVGKDVTESDIYLFGTFKDEGQYVYIPKGRYSINTISVPSGIYIAREKTKGSIINSENIIKTLSEQDCYFYSWIFRITKDGTYNSTIYPQMEVGNTATEYEPYKEIQSVQPTCELNGIDDVRDELIVRADGTGQLIQRLLEEELNDNSDYVTWYANTNTYGFLRKESKWLFRANKINIKSNKLKGITKEVGNPGTYDKNGIFVDVAGLYIKISKKYLTEYTVDALKTYLIENPITVVGLLKEPIVTELSSEEVQKILALRTNKPNTTIWNDQEAEMQVTYVADTKSYIDKKFKELSDAIVASASEAE